MDQAGAAGAAAARWTKRGRARHTAAVGWWECQPPLDGATDERQLSAAVLHHGEGPQHTVGLTGRHPVHPVPTGTDRLLDGGAETLRPRDAVPVLPPDVRWYQELVVLLRSDFWTERSGERQRVHSRTCDRVSSTEARTECARDALSCVVLGKV